MIQRLVVRREARVRTVRWLYEIMGCRMGPMTVLPLVLVLRAGERNVTTTAAASRCKRQDGTSTVLLLPSCVIRDGGDVVCGSSISRRVSRHYPLKVILDSTGFKICHDVFHGDLLAWRDI